MLIKKHCLQLDSLFIASTDSLSEMRMHQVARIWNVLKCKALNTFPVYVCVCVYAPCIHHFNIYIK